MTPRFGANADYIAYLGDGWDAAGTPHWQGSDASAGMWVNHAYTSGPRPKATPAPHPHAHTARDPIPRRHD